MSRAFRPSLGGLLYGLVAGTVAVGLGIAAAGPWRTGIGVCGAGLIGAAVGRTMIPDRMAGLLRVRRRGVDVLMMLAMGVGLVVLAAVVPGQP